MSKQEKYIGCVMFSGLVTCFVMSLPQAILLLQENHLSPILLYTGTLPLSSPNFIITVVFLTLNFVSINIFKTGRHFTHFSSC